MEKEKNTENTGEAGTGQDIQWHPAFVSAMNLEFAENRKDLVFEREHNLNTKPLEIDLLIKKEADACIRNEIGHFFRKYNILEYKAPGDRLDVDSYYKATAYGCLYKTHGETVDGRKAGEITVSLLRYARPEGLLRYFAQEGTTVEETGNGIYRLSGKRILFPTQVVVIRELPEETHASLRVLARKPRREDVGRFLGIMRKLTGKAEREYAQSVLEVVLSADRKWAEKQRGGEDMGPVLAEIMEPELREAEKKGMAKGIEEGMAKGIEEGMAQGIRGTVNILRGFGLGHAEIREAVMRQYGLSGEETEKFL